METEVAVPPLDIYLNKRVAEFEERLVASGMAQRIRGACATIADRLRKRAQRIRGAAKPKFEPPPKGGDERAEWAYD